MLKEKINSNLNQMPKTDIGISDEQLQFVIDKLQKIADLESKINNVGLNIEPNALSMPLLEREGIDSSIIEGTQTSHDEMYFDVSQGIRDKYSWEVRNLINVYKHSYRSLKDEAIDYNIDDLKSIHRDLFKRDIEGYQKLYDPIEIIKAVKPGKILDDDSKPNWIGPTNNINQATLILIKPSDKKRYLKDLFEEVRNNKGKKDLKTLIKFHPIFEAIHPFSDGNGRIGRVLLVKHNVPQASAYRVFDSVSKKLDATKGENHRFEKILKIISR